AEPASHRIGSLPNATIEDDVGAARAEPECNARGLDVAPQRRAIPVVHQRHRAAASSGPAHRRLYQRATICATAAGVFPSTFTRKSQSAYADERSVITFEMVARSGAAPNNGLWVRCATRECAPAGVMDRFTIVPALRMTARFASANTA